MSRRIILIAFLLGMLAGGFICWQFAGKGKNSVVERSVICRDTLIVRDTIKITEPKYIAKTLVRYDTILVSKPIELATNCSQVDSTKVAIPIEQKLYTDNYYYRAYVSGYKPQLDSIEVFRDTEYIYIDRPEEKPKRWGIGIQAGYGVAFTKQPTYAPYIGVGISYNLIRF